MQGQADILGQSAITTIQCLHEAIASLRFPNLNKEGSYNDTSFGNPASCVSHAVVGTSKDDWQSYTFPVVCELAPIVPDQPCS